MSPRAVPPHEMGPHDRPDPEFERLLARSASDDRTTELARLVAALRSDARMPDAEDVHVAAMIEAAAHLHAEDGDPAVRPVSNADAPARQVSRLPKRRGNDVPSRRSILLKVLAPAFALLMLFSGMAIAGVLPTPLQGAVDQWVGDDDDQGNAPVIDDDQGEDGDDQGEDGDDQGEDGDDQGEDGDDQTEAPETDTTSSDQAGTPADFAGCVGLTGLDNAICRHEALLQVKPDNPGLANSLTHLEANAAAHAARQGAKTAGSPGNSGTHGNSGSHRPSGS